MPIEIFNRVEKKYVIDNETFLILRNMLGEYMVKDKYNKDDKTYPICNIYYDTQDNYLIRNSIDKPIYKEKLRLRSYGIPKIDDLVFLEIKKKFNGITYKRRTRLKLFEAYEFIDNHKIPPDSDYINKQVLSELKYLIDFYNPVAKMKITYDRYAFFSNENKDLRISFDRNIYTDTENLRLESKNLGIQLLKENMWIMEIKTEKSVPLWLTQILSENKIYSTGFSKYGSGYKKALSKGREDNLCLVFQQEPLLAKSLH